MCVVYAEFAGERTRLNNCLVRLSLSSLCVCIVCLFCVGAGRRIGVCVQQLMHAIAMVHKMQRLALSSSSMIPAAIQEEKEEAAANAKAGVESSSTLNHREEQQLDAIDIDPSSSTAASPAAASSSTAPAGVPVAPGSSIADGSTADPMDL